MTWQLKAFMEGECNFAENEIMKKNTKVSLSKKPFLVLSRRAITGWVCVVFFICTWMFVIGLLVGRGTAPVKFDIAGFQNKLGISREDLKKQEPGRTQAEDVVEKDKTKLDFYEVLKENRDDTKIDELTTSPITIKKIAPLPGKKPSKTTGESTTKKSKPQKEVVKKAKPQKSEPVRPPQKQQITSKSRTIPSGKTYTIQAASVKAVRHADRLVAELKKKGFYAYRAIGKVPGKGIWYRVRIGEYKSRAEARRTMGKLEKAGFKPILVEK